MRPPLMPVLAAATLTAALLVPLASPAQAAATSQNYLVLFKSAAVPSDAAALISKAGGSLVAAYSQIGVAVASSSSSGFAAEVKKDTRVDGASATAAFVSRVKDIQADGSSAEVASSSSTGTDSLSPLQWDMAQIKAPQAHAIEAGSPSVVVGDIDTGLDYTHPDLAANVDFANSVSCLGGVANTAPSAWNDENGHGTHTAGTIAAAANGIGIVGVAPNVKIAGIRAGDVDGFFFPEAVVCAFVWAGSHHLPVTNNSYFADPYLFNCRNDAGQRAIWKAEQRAIRYAQGQGTLVVAAEGNESDDLSHPTVDNTSPDNTTPVSREVTNACLVVPVELPGVVGVTSDGNNAQDGGGYLKSFYSSYGTSTADVVAPGGDSQYGRNAAAANGRVLSTWPSTIPCTRKITEGAAVYCYLQGTSMASPHVAGVAALIASRNLSIQPGQNAAALGSTADPQPCPNSLPTTSFSGFDYLVDFTRPDGTQQQCQGGTGHNSWYGSGQVNALTAVSR